MPTYDSTRESITDNELVFQNVHFDFSLLPAADWTGETSADIGHGLVATLTRAGNSTTFGPNGTTGIRWQTGSIGLAAASIIQFDIADLYSQVIGYNAIYVCLDWAVPDDMPVGGSSGFYLTFYPTASNPDTNYFRHLVFRSTTTVRVVRDLSSVTAPQDSNEAADIRRLMNYIDTAQGLVNPYYSLAAGGSMPDWTDPLGDGFTAHPSNVNLMRSPQLVPITGPPGVAFAAYGSLTSTIDITLTDLWITAVTTWPTRNRGS